MDVVSLIYVSRIVRAVTEDDAQPQARLDLSQPRGGCPGNDVGERGVEVRSRGRMNQSISARSHP